MWGRKPPFQQLKSPIKPLSISRTHMSAESEGLSAAEAEDVLVTQW